jgi:hypothetical protein
MDAFEELPLLGPALESFSSRFMSSGGLPNFGWVVTGTLIVLTILVEPRGLHGLWIRVGDMVGGKRADSSDPPADPPADPSGPPPGVS